MRPIIFVVDGAPSDTMAVDARCFLRALAEGVGGTGVARLFRGFSRSRSSSAAIGDVARRA